MHKRLNIFREARLLGFLSYIQAFEEFVNNYVSFVFQSDKLEILSFF